MSRRIALVSLLVLLVLGTCVHCYARRPPGGPIIVIRPDPGADTVTWELSSGTILQAASSSTSADIPETFFHRNGAQRMSALLNSTGNTIDIVAVVAQIAGQPLTIVMATPGTVPMWSFGGNLVKGSSTVNVPAWPQGMLASPLQELDVIDTNGVVHSRSDIREITIRYHKH